jgi:short-subunit dehydrogenase
MGLLDGSVLVTGATGGIGRAIAEAFAAHGAQLTLTGRRRDVLDRLSDELRARAVVCDLGQRSDVEHLAAEAGDVDVLVANAALPASGVFTELEQEQIDRMLEVNLRAPIALVRALAPGMVARRSGHIVLISSLSGKVASPASAIYAATKFGLRGFAHGIREDLHPHGVGVSVVLPGFISDAGMFADSGAKLPRGVGTRSPQDVAAAVIRAVSRNRAELDVAPLGLRLGAAFASLAPELAATVSRRLGAGELASAMAEGQRDRR